MGLGWRWRAGLLLRQRESRQVARDLRR